MNSPASIYTYGRWYYPNEVQVVVDNPDSTQLFWSRFTDTAAVGKGLLHSVKVRLDDWATERQSTAFTYTNDPGGSPQVQSITSTITNEDATATQTKVDFDYDLYGNLTNKREYGFQINGSWQVQRRTSFLYKTDAAYINANLRSLVTEAVIYDPQNNVIAKTAFTYDDYQSMGGMEEYPDQPPPPGHTQIGASAAIRGNVTGTTQWADTSTNATITRLARYDKFGNVVKAQVSCCQEKVFTYTEDTYWSQPAQVTSNGMMVSVTDSNDHDFNTSLVMTHTDPRNQTVAYGYNAALALTSATLPTGAAASAGYNYGQLSSSSSTSYDDGGVQKTLTSSVQYDGWGREIQKVDTNGAQVNTAYDAMGRVSSKTNPFAQGSQTISATIYLYDALGRVKVATLPDGNTIRSEYSGSGMTVTDQVNRKTRREVDGLGRLVKIIEQDQNGLLTQETAYSYNLLDKLTQVNQGGQIRSYKYDALGRLLYERIPEQTATINEAGGLWTTKYTYTNFNAVETRKDARGVVTSYTYDGLHRLTQIGYNTTNAPTVATTPAVSYSYDSTGALMEVNVGDYSETYSFDTDHRVNAVTRRMPGQVQGIQKTYTTSYDYNGVGQLKKLTYPSGNVVNLTHDDRGRLSGMPTYPEAPWQGGYLSAVSYNSIGQLSGLTLGNGVVESYAYDPQRLQLTSKTATKNGTSHLSLTYSYQAPAGRNGPGTTAGNTGQLMNVSGSVNGQAESSSYSYDLQARLATSNQLIAGTANQRRFVYDRWGNRTQVWDAVSGGNQIQSVTIAQSGAAPDNRIANVNGVSYTYDAAGNVIWDGAHAYQYDAENRLVSVDNGATAQYRYDHLNRRISKVIGSSFTHYIWEGYQVISEHDASTAQSSFAGPPYQQTSARADYVYLGGRMIYRRTRTGSTAQWSARYMLSDRLSTRLTMDVSGAVVGSQYHGSWGEASSSGEADKRRFTSYERDSEMETDYAVNRHYAATVGRFMRSDPYAGSYRYVNPQSFNRYAYVQNDPINSVDPLGLFCVWIEVSGGDPILICTPERKWIPAAEPVVNKDQNPPVIHLPCTNEDGTLAKDGFTQDISGDRVYSAEELNHAAATILGEMSPRYNDNSRAEAEAIASIILNRSSAIRNAQVPPNTNWGADANLISVVSANGQFAGYDDGWEIYSSNVDFQAGARNCNRLKAAGAAIGWLAANPGARRPYLYMCARSHVGRRLDPGNDVVINGNVFSPNPLNCR